jgi:hypothetical protein
MDTMATFLEIRTRVQERVIDLPTAVQNRVPVLVNQAIRDMQRMYNYRAMEVSQIFVTTAGSLSLTPSSITRFKEFRDKGPYLLSYLTKAQRYIAVSQPNADLAVLSDVNLPDRPRFLINNVDATTGATTFTIAPYPNLTSDWPDGNYRIVVPAYVYSADLVADGDQNWFTNFADDYIEHKAASEAFGLDWDYDKQALLAQLGTNILKNVVKADKMNRLSAVDTFVPMWQGANKPQVRM